MDVSGELQVVISAVALIILVLVPHPDKISPRIRAGITIMSVIFIFTACGKLIEPFLISRVWHGSERLHDRSHHVLGFVADSMSAELFEISPSQVRYAPDAAMQYQINLLALEQDSRLAFAGVKINLEHPVNLRVRAVAFQVRLQNVRGENIGSPELYAQVKRSLSFIARDNRDLPFRVSFNDFCEYVLTNNLLSCELNGQLTRGIEREAIIAFEFHVQKSLVSVEPLPSLRAEGGVLLSISDIRFVRP